ncbi:MAG: TonB-dependent receptor plug domain-containing protein, partial [Robiginitomaculum sp.]|nr:TonB-dependent receptor plug domain-containing protein [Robiginitomaculum sp.]
MKSLDLKTLLLGGSLLAGTFAYSTMGYAQETTDDVIELVDEEAEENKKDNIIVTGSRIKRDTFSSIAPLQIITAESSIKAGLIDPAQILQQSESAAGTQIDATFNGFVLDNGPNSQTLNLRGLSPSRTLVLINGRRSAPSGVEGAPINASINQIPGSLVERYDLLLDGSSSVYGSE